MADLIRRDPFRDMMSLRDAMDRLFEESFVRPFGGWPLLSGGPQSLALDMVETDESLVVEASLPADVSADKADASFQNGVLKLTLPKVEEAKPKRIEVKVK